MCKGNTGILKFCQVRTKARIVEGDAGKAICREAERLKPAAVVMGTRGRSIFQRYKKYLFIIKDPPLLLY